MTISLCAALCHAPEATPVPVTALKKDAYNSWLEKAPAATRQWLQATGFEAKAGASRLIPEKDGSLARVLIILEEEPSLWDLASLPSLLQDGFFRLENAHGVENLLALGWLLGGYHFTPPKTQKGTPTLCVSKSCAIEDIERQALAIAQAQKLITLPAEEMGPEELAQEVQKTGKKHGAKIKIIVGDALLKKNYPAIHAIGRASHRAPRLIDLQWGSSKHPLLTLVGKGVCFDTGGLDLKPPAGMYLMRKDMAGAAVALGLAGLIMAEKLPVRLRLLISAVDNSINERALRPTDIVTMRNGLKVEIGNTDAEGRMILADALSEAASQNPDLVIDFGTLGVSRSIFGVDMASFFTKDDALAKVLYDSAQETQDYLWRMPLHPPYAKKLKTPFADINSSPRVSFGHGMIAGAFLESFTKNVRALHIDFYGWYDSAQAGRPEGGAAQTMRAAFNMLKKRYTRV
ncbi:MAG: leucyl aminopeptidase family protein [Alphaproteobacteria bacterium]|nr:leucyl aminopeptidase family protein [Alphaproteobacteria bacterium]